MTTATLAAIVAATFVSEDLTAVAVGLALREGSLPLVPGLLACIAGIYLGDIGLLAAGRFAGRRVLRWRVMTRMPVAALHRLGRWVDEHPALAIFGSRCLPGTRVPLYLAAGIWGEFPLRTACWMFVAVAVWTPLLVVGAMLMGEAIRAVVDDDPATRWLVTLGAGGSCLALLHFWRRISTPDGRRALSLACARATQWEFWPSWPLYAPVVVWLVWLAIRYRSLTVFTAANPHIEDGGFVGESKSAILASLPPQWVMPWVVIEPGDLETRVDAVATALADRAWTFPLVAKPDVGQRGAGVAWLYGLDDTRRYLARAPGRLVLQVPHMGPHEAGLFYVRMPGAARGRIFSITDKRFPMLIGDGQSSMEELIRSHPRYRLQASVFLTRLAGERTRVLGAGERASIGLIGNHCKGAEFLDGQHLWTPALETRVDAIAHAAGFYFGRFDVRYRDVDAFMAGNDLAILELNGVTSEATHIYGGTLWRAWGTLMTQWSLAFAVGAAHRAGGHQPTSLARLLRLIAGFARA